jgi:hypothetical protein
LSSGHDVNFSATVHLKKKEFDLSRRVGEYDEGRSRKEIFTALDQYKVEKKLILMSFINDRKTLHCLFLCCH